MNCGAFSWYHWSGSSGWEGGGGGGMPSDITNGLNQYLGMVNFSIEELWLRNNFIVQRGPGGVYYSRDLAGAAAAQYGTLLSDGDGNEHCNALYASSEGTVSYMAARTGNENSCGFSNSTPVGTYYVGFYHSHPSAPGDYDSERFSEATTAAHGGDITIALSPVNDGMPWFLGTPTDRVLKYDPGAGFVHGCVLVGTAVPPTFGRSFHILAPYVPRCF
jgi:hypothetical protein